MPDSPQAEATRRAELLVSSWHVANRRFCGQGGGLDWQAKRALILDIAAALVAPLAEVEALRADAAAPKPPRAKKANEA